MSSSDKKVIKNKKKNKLKAKTEDWGITFKQCISCGILIDTGDYCDGKSCKFDSVKRSNSISYTQSK
jgi:hypothetical protein